MVAQSTFTICNPAPLGLFAFALTTALLQVSTRLVLPVGGWVGEWLCSLVGVGVLCCQLDVVLCERTKVFLLRRFTSSQERP